VDAHFSQPRKTDSGGKEPIYPVERILLKMYAEIWMAMAMTKRTTVKKMKMTTPQTIRTLDS
jgi:hypothetical protein